MFAYIGSRTTKARKALGEGITVYKVGDSWEKIQSLPCGENPSYLCLNKKQDRLYAIHGDGCTVTALKVAEDGTLTEMNTAPTYGTNPVHLVLSPDEKSLYIANLETGSIGQLAVNEDGSLGAVEGVYFVPGKDGHGYISHPHQLFLHPDGKWLLVPCQGRINGVGQVKVYAISPEDNTLTPAYTWTAKAGAEPRHMGFHPNGKWAYLVNEKDSTAIYFHFDEETGKLEPQQVMTTLPDDYFGAGWASGLVMGNGGKYVYVSNRTHDTLTVYAVDQATGRLTYLQNISAGGVQPRFIGLNPDGTKLLAACELTHVVNVFAIGTDGKLTREETQVKEGSPVCVEWKD